MGRYGHVRVGLLGLRSGVRNRQGRPVGLGHGTGQAPITDIDLLRVEIFQDPAGRRRKGQVGEAGPVGCNHMAG